VDRYWIDDNKKLLILETVMATNPWMYSRTKKTIWKKYWIDREFTKKLIIFGLHFKVFLL
jgi:hypothetical protein